VVALIEILSPIIVLALFGILTPIVGFICERGRVRNLVGAWALFGFIIAFMACFRLMSLLNSKPVIIFSLYPIAGEYVAGFMVLDWLSFAFSIGFIFLGLISTLHSIDYMSHDTGLPSYYSLLLLMVCGMVGVTLAGDFLTLYVFWELMSLSSYCLVGFRKHLWEPVEAGFKYLLMSAAGSALILFSMSLIYGLTGSLSFARIAASLTGASPSILLYVIFILLLVGFGVKAAIVPFHSWLPDAHPAAPSPVSAMLSGVVIKTGVYAIIRASYTLITISTVDFRPILALLSVLTMTVGNLLALVQKDIKRLLAYSSIAQIGYLILALSLGTEFGLLAGIVHFFNHALMKGLAFLCAGSIIHVLGTRNMDEFIGVGRRMPVTGISFAIALLSLAGMPFLNGFISKYLIFAAAIDAKAYLLTLIGLLNSAVGVVYYVRVIQVLFRKPIEAVMRAHESPPLITSSLVILSLLCIVFGIWPQPLSYVAELAAHFTFQRLVYITSILKF
jgi:proton-translocating NADH-quinone oxidoreductase chain N